MACQCSTAANRKPSITVEHGTFEVSTEVKAETTQTKETAEAFNATVITDGPGAFRRAKSETRITAGKNTPKKGMTLTLNIPEELRADLESSKLLYAFVEYFSNGEKETHDSFQAVPIQNKPPDSVSITLEPAAFTNLRNKDGIYEAVAVLASGPR